MAHVSLPDGLLCQATSAATTKIKNFKKAGANQLQLVFDFDRTLTIGRLGAHYDVTTWHIMHEHLPQTGKDRYRALFEYNRALEVNGTLTQTQAIAWWSSILDLFAEHHINMAEVEQDFLSKATIRPGTKELFDLCEQHHIPTIILSAGIKDVIELWTRAYNIRSTAILSTSLQPDTDKRVHGWDKHTLVHALNKKEIGHPELARIRKQRAWAILIGDGLNDADMAEGTDTVFRIRVYDPRTEEKVPIETVRQQTYGLFDTIIETGTLRPLHQLVSWITA